MKIFIQHIIDFLFPPSVEELKLRSLSPEEFVLNAKESDKPEFSFIKSLFSYKDPLVKELIWQIKYRKNKHAVAIAGFALHQAFKEPALLIPIPISKKRRRERGYNQCELIIHEVARLDSEKKLQMGYGLLIRSRHIEKQTHKNRNERLENTKSIFEVTKKENLHQKIIIIDDVSTTGSTLKEARDILLSAGYSDITALTLAH
ncbi:MAG: competence protein ComFC [Patescibacteria group bacterium]|nr:competence protein ComFC [Patescibacteria group bacterium]